MRIKITLPTTFESSYLEELDKLNTKYSDTKREIREVYGSFQTSILGSARPSKYLPAPTKKQFKDHIKKAHSFGIKFSYLANAPCLGNIEYSAKGRKEILDFLDGIAEIGIDSIVVTIPLLIEIIRERHPHIEIVASSLCYISDIRAARRFEEMGVQRIVIDPDVNRNLSLLKRMKNSLKGEIEVIANHTCIISCHLEYYHYNNTGHGSQRGDKKEEMIYNQYSLLRCTLEKLKNPGEFLASPWFAPRDIKYLDDAGIDWIKLAGRGSKREELLALGEAYLKGKYDGNLLPLLGWPHHLAFRKKSSIEKLEALEVYLDEKDLNGFMEFFEKGFPCEKGCEECDFCHKKAGEVLKYDKKLLNQYIENMERILDRIIREDLSEEHYRKQVTAWMESAKICYLNE